MDEKKGEEGNGGVVTSASPIIINVQSTPVSPRLAHLRPASPLTPEAMHRIQQLTVQEQTRLTMTSDAQKWAPTSPTTSDLGSSRRSSVNVTTSMSSWSTYRETTRSSSDFTDVDSDISKDLFSPSITLSPAPFSPFSEQSPLVGPRSHFSFDPKSPPFAPGRFLLPPPTAYGTERELSLSDSDTTVKESDRERSASLIPNVEGVVQVPTKVDQDKNVYKKRLLRKYEEEAQSPVVSSSAGYRRMSIEVETVSDPDQSSSKSVHLSGRLDSPKSIALPLVQQHPPVSKVFARSSSVDYDQSGVLRSDLAGPISPAQQSPTLSTPWQSARLPLVREETRLSTIQATLAAWLERQRLALAVNPFWYDPNTATGANVPRPFTGPPAMTGLPGVPPFLVRFPPPPQAVAAPVAVNPFALPAPPPLRPIYRPFPIYPPLHPDPPQRYPLHQPHPPQLSMSRRSRSESDASYECQYCGQAFNVRDRLAKHLACRHREHSTSVSGTKNYRCTVCQKQFGRSDMLTRHMRLHTGVRPYVCQTCGQVFSRSDHLSTHLRTHTGEKPYQCPVCPYAATRRDMITRHMRVHSRSVEYTCDEPSTSSGFGHMSAIEEALSGEKSQLDISKESPNSESGGSTGSASTVLYIEEIEEGGTKESS